VILMLHSPLQRRLLDLFAAQGVWISVVASASLTIALISAFDLWILRRVHALSWVVYPRRKVTG
jgi:hypothetical protein